MKLNKKIGLLAILITFVFSLNVFAQFEAARLQLDAKKELKNKNGEETKFEDVIVVKNDSFFNDIAQTTSYTFATTTTGSLTDMSTGTTTLVAANLDDTASALTNIGFDFYFQGVRYTQFGVNENGVLRLGAASQTGSPYQPLAQAAIPLITAYGADQRTHTTGSVRFKVIGAAPNRTLVVEWFNCQSNFNSGGTADLTYQVRLSETTGVIEFVYGSMNLSAAAVIDANSNDPQIGFSSSNVANTVGSVDAPISGAPPPSYNGASAVPTNNTTYTVAGPITVLTSATNGSRRTFSFTPPLPTAPTALNFTAVTATSYTVNWTDSADEDLYAIYRSTDGINYTFQATAAENAVSFAASGLSPSTNYFWQVYSVSEGALSSTALSGSQMTAAAGNDTCNGAGGNWMTPGSWTDGSVPTAGDNVTIGPACVMVINTTAPIAINVTVQSGGTLIYDTLTAATLTVNGDVTVDAGGTFNAGTGALATHVLNIGGNTSGSAAAGNLIVNGTFDMNTTAGVTTNFFGSTDGTVSGTGATCDFFAIVMQKGTSQTPMLDVTRVITGNTPAASANRLSATNGTFRLSSASTWTPWFGSQTLTATTGRIWVNNAGATLTVVGVGTGTGAGAPTVNGGLRVDSGTWGYGSGNNTLTIGASGTLQIGGGTVNMFGAVAFTSGATFNMTGGNFNVDPQAANALGSTTNVVRFNVNTVNFTGGTMTIVDPHNAASTTGKELSISTSNSALMNFIGGTIKFGDGVSSSAGSTDGFEVDTFVSTQQPFLGNVIIDNPVTNAATRFFRVNTALAPLQFLVNNLTITAAGGSRFNLNANLVAVTGNVVNDGTMDGTVAGSRLYWLGAGSASTYSGSGTSVAPLVSWDIDNALGVTITSVNNVVCRRVILFTGSLTGSNKITLGNGDATVNVVQIGNASPNAGTAAGLFDVPFTFNLGAGGETITYQRTLANRSTGPEVNPTRSLVSMTYDDNIAGRTLTVAGGDLTVAGTLALTNGIVATSTGNALVHNGTTVTRTASTTSCFVDGPMRREYPAATGTTYTFHVGEGVYSPVGLASIVTVGATSLTAEAINTTLTPFSPTTSISRNWSLTETGDLTAIVSFTYDQTDDVNGNEADYRLFRRDSGAPTEVCGITCVDETTNVGTTPSISSFSRWTMAEALGPTAAMVNVGGRVTLANGVQGVPRVMVTISGGSLPQPITRMTNPFGYYTFENLQVGQTYVITVGSKQYTFSVPSRIITPDDNVTNADFIADGAQ